MGAVNHTLKSDERLKSKKLFDEVFAKGKHMRLHELTAVYYMPETKMPVSLKAGFSVPKRRFKKAVDRNRLKRLMREAYRTQKNEIENVLKTHNKQLVVVFVFTFTQMTTYVVVKEKMHALLQNLQKHVTKTNG